MILLTLVSLKWMIPVVALSPVAFSSTGILDASLARFRARFSAMKEEALAKQLDTEQVTDKQGSNAENSRDIGRFSK